MMNELIKKLMLKAGGVLAPAYVTDENDNSVWTENAKVDTIDMDAEYFARLLLRECSKLNNQFIGHRIGEIDLDMVYKEHFGV